MEDGAAGKPSQLPRATIEEIQAKAQMILDEVAGLVHANDQLLKQDHLQRRRASVAGYCVGRTTKSLAVF